MMKLFDGFYRLLGKGDIKKESATEQPSGTSVVQSNAHNATGDVPEPSIQTPLPISNWTGMSISKKQSEELKERIKQQKARHVASESEEMQRYNPLKLSPTIMSIIDRPASSVNYGTLDVFPMELVILIMDKLPPESLALLALTNTTYMSLVGHPPWESLHESKHKVLGKEKDSVYFRFLCTLEKDLQQGPTPIYFCSDCVAFHPSTHFAVSQLREIPEIRMCDAAIGTVELAPHTSLTWSNMQDIPNNTITKLSRTMEPERGYLPRWILRPFLEQKSVHVEVKILKKAGMVCVQTRWNMSYPMLEALVKGDEALLKGANDCPGWLCPHSNLANLQSMWRMWKNHCTGCSNNTEPRSHLDFIQCHNIIPMRCIFCSTEMEHEIKILPNGKAHYEMTTLRILGKDADPTTREWRSQCGPDYDHPPLEHYRIRNAFRRSRMVKMAIQELQVLPAGRHYRMPRIWDRAGDIQACPGCNKLIRAGDATWTDPYELITHWHYRCRYRIPLRPWSFLWT